MSALSVRDIPDVVYEQFKAAAQSDGLTAEAKVRQYVIREARRWELAGDENRIVGQATWLRRSDGELFHGSLTLRIAVVQRDWDAVRYLAPEQETAHGTSALDTADWEYLRNEAAKDGVRIDSARNQD